MAENNLIGEEFKEYVRKQINVRQKIHGSGTPNNPRSIEYLNYLNSKTAWVKLASGVNILEERLQREGMDTSFYGMELAKERVLFGGVASLEGNKLTQRGTNSNRNLNITDPNSGTYNVNQKNKIDDLEFGLVPMPGITSVDIKNKNRGSIKEATVKLTAYTREQFDFIDLLYMRLGYTVFLEWGWSTYFDNDENNQTMDYTLLEDSDGFFNESWGHVNDIPILTNQQRLPYQTQQSIPSKTFSDFLIKITEYRRKHDGNYDGLLAKVRNFDWTISENGTYDITLSLISVGDVIESLKMNMPPTKEVIDFFTTLNTQKEENQEEGVEVEIFPINNSIKAHLNLWKLSDQQSPVGFLNSWENGLTYRLNSRDIIDKTGITGVGRFVQFQPTLKILINDEYNLLSSDADDKISELNKQYKEEIKQGLINISKFPWGGNGKEKSYYITISGQKIINLSEITSDASDTRKEVFILRIINKTGDEVSWDVNPQYYMRLGYLLQYIENTIIPLEKNTLEKMIKIHTDQWDSNRMYHFPYQQSYDPRVCLVRSTYPVGINQSLEILPQLPGWFEEGNDYAFLMNIYVNFSQIESSINDNLDEEGNLSLFDFLSSLCTAINKALGGVNNLEPVIEEETNTIRIIDGSYTSNAQPITDYTLELYGYNPSNNSSNFVRNFSVKSTISKEYASMISIGATAAGYTKGMEATMFSKWNTGIIDRFKEEYVPPDPSTNPTGSENEAVINYIENVLFKNPTTLKSPVGGYYLDTELIDTQVSFATEFYKYCQYQFQQKYPKYGSPIIGFVPISLNLTMDGISGMKIYNVVRTSTRFLPKNYTDSLRFITTSVNHKLNNNDWETTIDTIVIPENYDELGNEILPYNARFEEVKRILIESATLKYGPKTQTDGKEARNSVNNEGFFTSNRSGDTSLGIEGKSYQGELAKDALSDQGIQEIVKSSNMELKPGKNVEAYLRDNAIRKRIVEIAASYVGLNELPGNNQGWHNIEYENKFKELQYKWAITQPWCAWFCQLVWKEAFTTGNAYTPSIDSTASAVNIPTTFADTYKGIWNGLLEGGAIVSPGTATIKKNFETNPKLQFITRKQVLDKTKTPKPGDIAKYTYTGGGHVDIVVATYPGGYAAIGGNTGAGNSRDGGATKYFKLKKYNATSLVGFAVVPTISNQKT
jgi:hypothetical protein